MFIESVTRAFGRCYPYTEIDLVLEEIALQLQFQYRDVSILHLAGDLQAWKGGPLEEERLSASAVSSA